jgi:HPt (histidine-containing phosphotransfer) domain-containing protein
VAEPNDEAGPTEASAALEKLRERFVAGLPQRWHEIAHGTELSRRRQALHRLAGAAGSYGFDAVSTAARTAEQALAGGDAAAFDLALAQLHDRLAEQGVTLR